MTRYGYEILNCDLLALLCSPSLIAAPGGGHHKVTAYDYHDYLNSAIQSKTFIYHFDGVVNDLVWTFDRSNPREVIRIEEVTEANSNVVLRYGTRTFTSTAESFDLVQAENYNPATIPPELEDTVDYTPPLIKLTSAMVPGIAWGSAGIQDSILSGQNYYFDKTEILAVEDVSVTAGTFQNCLKIHSVHQFRAGSSHAQMDWFCPGMGLVKRIHNRELLDLVSLTYNERGLCM